MLRNRNHIFGGSGGTSAEMRPRTLLCAHFESLRLYLVFILVQYGLVCVQVQLVSSFKLA